MRRLILFLLGWGAKIVDALLTAAVNFLTRLSARLKGWRQLPPLGARLKLSQLKTPFPRWGFPAWAKRLGAAPIKRSIPTAPLVLPRDLAAHDWAKMEWWYYTGHLAAPDGRRFGFEITFFTYRLTAEDGYLLTRELPITAIMGHFAVVDEQAGVHRSGIVMGPEVGIADVSKHRYHIHFATWRAQGDEQDHRIFAETLRMKLSLRLIAKKPPVLHGGRGIVMKDEDLANYYLSITRLAAQGTLRLDDEDIPVTGQAWFDREFGYMGNAAAMGWDWFSLQLDDNTEIMLYAIKDEDGQTLKESRACRIDAQGQEQTIPYSEIRLEVLGHWQSPKTRATYPSGWRLVITLWDLDLTITPTVAAQEFTKGPLPYWEGSCRVTGSHSGRAFIELVGYARGWGQKWLRLLR